jgi:hypothetical protein
MFLIRGICFQNFSKAGIESEGLTFEKGAASCKHGAEQIRNSIATFGFMGIEAGSSNRIIRGYAPEEREVGGSPKTFSRGRVTHVTNRR